MGSRDLEQPGPSGLNSSGQGRRRSPNEYPFMQRDGEKEELLPNSNVWICKNVAEILRNYPLYTENQDIPKFMTEMLLKSLMGVEKLNLIISNFLISGERHFELPPPVIAVIKDFIHMRYTEANLPSPFEFRSVERLFQLIFTRTNSSTVRRVNESPFFTRSSEVGPLRVDLDQFLPESPHFRPYHLNGNGASNGSSRMKTWEKDLQDHVYKLFPRQSNGSSNSTNNTVLPSSGLPAFTRLLSAYSQNSSIDLTAIPSTSAASDLLQVNDSDTNQSNSRSSSPSSHTSSISDYSTDVSPTESTQNGTEKK